MLGYQGKSYRVVMVFYLLLLAVLAAGRSLLASGNGPAGLARVEASRAVQEAGAAASLLLYADAVVLATDGGATGLTAIAHDPNGQPVAGVTIQFSSEQGNITPESAVTGEDGTAVTTFTAGDTPGQAVITATAGELSQSLPLQIAGPQQDAVTYHLSVTAEADRLKPGQQTTVSARLLDATGRPLRGQPLTFFGSLGEVSPGSIISDTSGRATATFRAGNATGRATLVVLAGYGSALAYVEVEADSAPTPTPTPTSMATPTPTATAPTPGPTTGDTVYLPSVRN